MGAVLILALRRKPSRGNRETPVIAAFILAVLMFSAVVGWETLLRRFDTNDLFVIRREAWEAGIAMIRERSLGGIRVRDLVVYPHCAVSDIGVFMNAAHSDWLQWGGDGGVPFVILMAVLAARAAQLSFRDPWGSEW